ncbi:MAG: UDP-N-acetylglucosamine pyrophosphorylase [Bacilli bacterium]|nr:UDP-N-acetylglucosamine pyrophosphorylase [Bacilli bacterium]
MKNKDLFLTKNSIAYDLISKYEYPFEVLPNINAFIIEKGKTLDDSYEIIDDNIWVAKDANVSNSASIMGPCIIDHKAEIRHNAFIRGNAIIGKKAVLGNSCEIKNSILFDEVQVPHFNYVGDSIIGYRSHLGAGAITSNLKSDKSTVVIKGNSNINTNLKKVGAFLGDYVEIGCNSVLNPGTVIGRNTSVYPLSNIRGVIEPDKIVKQNEIVPKK